MSELIRCPTCNGTGKRPVHDVAYENLFGAAAEMAHQMGAIFELNAHGERQMRQEVARLLTEESTK